MLPDFIKNDTFSVSPWGLPPQEQAAPWKPACADDPDLKTAFGIEWAKQPDAFKAALVVLNEDTTNSLWASQNWVKDPSVIATRDAYVETAKKLEKPLDKEQLLAKVLAFAEEKDIYGRPLVEAKERLNAFKLYSEIQGFTGKVDINASTNILKQTNNLTKIVLVKPEEKATEPTIIEASNIKSEMTNDTLPAIKLKLVGGVR